METVLSISVLGVLVLRARHKRSLLPSSSAEIDSVLIKYYLYYFNRNYFPPKDDAGNFNGVMVGVLLFWNIVFSSLLFVSATCSTVGDAFRTSRIVPDIIPVAPENLLNVRWQIAVLFVS